MVLKEQQKIIIEQQKHKTKNDHYFLPQVVQQQQKWPEGFNEFEYPNQQQQQLNRNDNNNNKSSNNNSNSNNKEMTINVQHTNEIDVDHDNHDHNHDQNLNTPHKREQRLSMKMLVGIFLLTAIGTAIIGIIVKKKKNNDTKNVTTTTIQRQNNKSIIELEIPTQFETPLEFSPNDYFEYNNNIFDPEDDGKDKENNNNNNNNNDLIYFKLKISKPNTLITLVQLSSKLISSPRTSLLVESSNENSNNDNNNNNSRQSFSLQPIGRSYDGFPWEISAGKFAKQWNHGNGNNNNNAIQFIDCSIEENDKSKNNDDNFCLINLSTNYKNHHAIYQITTFDKPSYSNRDIIARFLEQTTFGPTTTMIDEIITGLVLNDGDGDNNNNNNNNINNNINNLNWNFARWIQNQQNMPLSTSSSDSAATTTTTSTTTSKTTTSSHREIFRQRLNAQQATPSPIGPITSPCSKGSRYRRTAFSTNDGGKILTITTLTATTTNNNNNNDNNVDNNSGDNSQIRFFSVNGQIRTTIQDSSWYVLNNNRQTNNDGVDNNNFILIPITLQDGEYEICQVLEEPSIVGTTVMFPINNANGPVVRATGMIGGSSLLQINLERESTNDTDNDTDNGQARRPCQVLFFANQNDNGTISNPNPNPSPIFLSNPPIHFDESSSSSLNADGSGSNSAVLLLEISNDGAAKIGVNGIENPPGGSDNNLLLMMNQGIILTSNIHQCDLSSHQNNNNNNNEEVVFATWRDSMYIHEPRFLIFDNTIESPLPDGGGSIANDFSASTSGPIMCSNVARNFLNENDCFMSDSSSACTAASDFTAANNDGDDLPEAFFTLSDETIRIIFEASGGGSSNGGGAGEGGVTDILYLYAIDGLDVTRDPDVPSPCTPGAISRWIQVSCEEQSQETSSSSTQIGRRTLNLLSRMISRSYQNQINPYLLDVRHPPNLDVSCQEEDMDLVGFIVPDQNQPDSLCWKNVHPDHLNVYDFTQWTRNHPGNSDRRNPIKEFAEAGQSRLVFPDWHELTRWDTFKGTVRVTIPLGGEMNYYRLPAAIRTDRLAQALGVQTRNAEEGPSDTGGIGTLVCGSPNEVANQPFLGGSFQNGAFGTPASLERRSRLAKQRETAWTIAVLTDPAQLRQRVAWALSQILAVSPQAFNAVFQASYTEPFLVFYDIFIRHAFGNYLDILREVSYSPMMAVMLSYFAGQSTAFVYTRQGKVEYADENYAREVMQLFTTGLFQLNKNGTEILNESGTRKRVYTNNDIEEYARAWTGFNSQAPRSNAEGDLLNTPRIDRNFLDPMRVIESWRDHFPKMGLNRKYIGDGYPLCSDLPLKHFLKTGATYRLLGKSSTPELQVDPIEWQSDINAAKASLDPSSQLYSVLCSSINGQCSFPAKVVLDSNLECLGIECDVDTFRVIEITDGVYYEYVRPPCIHQAFFDDAKMLLSRRGAEYTCGDPRIETGSVACCSATPTWNEMFFGERTLFSTAQDRCENRLCTTSNRPRCDNTVDSRCLDNYYIWSEVPCGLFVKINDAGKVAIVHQMLDNVMLRATTHVSVDSKTFFRVEWDGNYQEILSDCKNIQLCSQMDDGTCVCEVSISDEKVFSEIPNRDDLLSSLHIGAFGSMRTPGITFAGTDDIAVHNLGINGDLAMDSVFEYLDQNGIRQLRKNMRSIVNVKGTSLKFRNPPHFINLADPEPRDAYYETDATLEHYLYHSNTAPFLAIRFAQRFGISNPSPNYIEAIADAFQKGIFEYKSDGGNILFGKGKYGDLAATFAALILHPESRNIVLDSDPTHGGFKEPLLKIIGLMRSFSFGLKSNEAWVEFNDSFGDNIGQMAHQLPSVFSFFHPEYQPSGPIADAGLVAPEAQRLTGPRIIASMNGIFSLIKYGLSSCFGGFAPPRRRTECANLNIGSIAESSIGSLTHQLSYRDNTVEAIINELATLMTAGRLSSKNREVVEAMFVEQAEEAVRKAQLLIASSPEFHSTNLVRRTGEKRYNEPPRALPSRPYKALVYVMLAGGYDSYNMLVPHSCSTTNRDGQFLHDQYMQVRYDLALTEQERSRIINVQGQPCEQFAVHEDLPVVERLYNNGELAFFVNTGALDVPVTKEDYYVLTQTELFAHNTMQEEAQRMDPFDFAPDTGTLGRLCDVLLSSGYSPQPIVIQDATVATVGSQADMLSPMIISIDEQSTFSPSPRGEHFDMREYAARMNDATKLHSSIYGESWSQKLHKAILETDLLADAIQDVKLTQEYTESQFGKKAKSLAQTILTHETRGSDRDVIYLELSGWDMHADMKPNLSLQFQELNSMLNAFEEEMKANGLWDQVAIAITSDFGRTLTPNSGDGSDHAWGGHYMVLGGSVKGGQIHGEYPSDLTDNGLLNIGRGRLIPTLSWESMLNGLLEWMGADTDEDLDYCMPNRHRTGTELISMEKVFHSKASRKLRGDTKQ